MSFEDLPENVAEIPISTPGLGADLVDLLLTTEDRRAESLFLVPADEGGLLFPGIGAITFGGMDWRCSAEERETGLANIASMGIPQAIVGFASENWIAPHLLRQWRDAVNAAFAGSRTTLVGVYVVNLDDVLEISTGPLPALWAA
ncbi:MAG: hypothetical protein Q4G64_04410 [bacterium]|nr:hypothetical protein [bacterium]